MFSIKILIYKKYTILTHDNEIFFFPIKSRSKSLFLSPSNEVSFKKVKQYQKKLEDELVQDSLENIFNENKINEYLKSLF